MTPLISRDDASTYFADILNIDAWDDASEETQTKALNVATKILNGLDWVGKKADPDQENCFPRGGDLSCQTEVPSEIQEACADIALALLNDIDPDEEIDSMRILTEAYSTVRITYDGSVVPDYILAGVPSATAWKKILPYLRASSTITLNRVS